MSGIFSSIFGLYPLVVTMKHMTEHLLNAHGQLSLEGKIKHPHLLTEKTCFQALSIMLTFNLRIVSVMLVKT